MQKAAIPDKRKRKPVFTNEQLQQLFPIGAIALYPDCQIATVLRLSPQVVGELKKKVISRGRITHLSQKSLNRLNFLVQTTTVELKSMLTLTYLCPPTNGKAAKLHLKMALQWLKRRNKNELSYIWFCEFTRAGFIHFHVLLSFIPDSRDRVDFANYWVAITDQGAGKYCSLKSQRELDVRESIIKVTSNCQSWEVIKKQDGAKRYVAKYATKPYQKKVPTWFQDIGRFWGASKDIKENREKAEIIELTEAELREILHEQGKQTARWDVLPRYLWGVTRPKL